MDLDRSEIHTSSAGREIRITIVRINTQNNKITISIPKHFSNTTFLILIRKKLKLSSAKLFT